jgi:hypothetical protein
MAAASSSGFSPLLEMDLPSQAGRWAKTREPGTSGAHLSHGGGESDLASSADPRRITQARLPSLPAHRLALAATGAQKPRCWPALARLFSQPPPGHRGDGLLHGPDPYFWRAVLFFPYRSRPAQDSTFNVSLKSPCSLDRRTVAAGVAVLPAHRFLLFDRDANFGDACRSLSRSPIHHP